MFKNKKEVVEMGSKGSKKSEERKNRSGNGSQDSGNSAKKENPVTENSNEPAVSFPRSKIHDIF